MRIEIARATIADCVGIAQITSYRTAYNRTRAQEMKQRAKTGMMLWTLEAKSVQTFYERLGGTLAGEKNYAVDDIKVTEVVHRRDDIDQLIQELEKLNGA